MRSWTANWRRLLALDEDGTACSSDYYLRLTSDGGRMLKGQIALTATRPTPPTTTSENPDLALNKPVSASGYTQTYVPSNAVDGDASTYWESTDSAFPQWFQVDLGAVTSISRIVMDLPPSSAWGARTQALEIQGSTDGSSYTTIAGIWLRSGYG